jgi:hypothetical protein
MAIIWIPGIIVLTTSETSNPKLHNATARLKNICCIVLCTNFGSRSGVSALNGGRFGCPSAGEVYLRRFLACIVSNEISQAGGLHWQRQ